MIAQPTAAVAPSPVRKRKARRPPTDRLVFLVEFLDLGEATGDKDAQWEDYQLRFLNSRSILTCDSKSRQVGWSFTAAAEGVAKAVLVPRSTVIFVSVTQVEANEKIRYSNYVIDALDKEVRPSKLIDNRTEIELTNGSRIISHPCRPPRGKAKADVYLDEIAHYPRDEEIYTAAVPIITRGGTIRMGSSPLGASGLFWEIHTEALQPYPGYVRQAIQWWTVAHLCIDLERAAEAAPEMHTPDRVYKYGSQRLQHIYENMPLEDFQQEYECDWSDESVAWITWDEIKRNQLDAAAGLHWSEEVQADDRLLSDVDISIEKVRRALDDGVIRGPLHGGMDVGRKRNLSEIVLIGSEPEGVSGTYPYRLGISLDRIEFEDQKRVLTKVIRVLPVERMIIDQMGLGMQLAENMENAFPLVCEGIDFTGQSKEEMAVEVKLRMQRGNAPIPLSRQLAYQIHSIKRMVTASKKLVFDTDRNEKHHADKFWAFALAHRATQTAIDFGAVRSPLAGYRG